MEVTHLYGNIRKELSYARPAVEDDCLDGVAHVLQCPSSLPVCIDRFALDFPDIEVLLQMRRPYDQDTEASFEEGDISDDYDRLRGMMVAFLQAHLTYVLVSSLYPSLYFAAS